MNDLMKTEFFVLINESSQEVTDKQISNAYENFVEQLTTVSQFGQDYSVAFRVLTNTRIELLFLSKQYQCGQEKKCV